MISSKKKLFIEQIFEKGIVRFGEFMLKDGMISPFYIDLRSIVAYPSLIKLLTELILENTNLDKDSLVCGVPYGAIPTAVSYGLATDKSMILLRKESKAYGTAKMMEGAWKVGQHVILIEDVITSGASILDSIDIIKQHQLNVKDVIVFVDREQGGVSIIRQKGYNVHVMVSIFDIVEVLKNHLGEEKVSLVKKFVAENKVADPTEPNAPLNVHPKTKHVLQCALTKKSNLVLSADVESVDELLALCKTCEPHISGVKIHADIIAGFTAETGKALKKWANEHHIFLIEDRKLADIGNTQHLQLSSGHFQISSWADMVTCHFIAGEQALSALEQEKHIGLLGLIEMSATGTLAVGQYTKKCLEIMQRQSRLFVGSIAQGSSIPSAFLKFTPGIHLEQSKDKLDQNYLPPQESIQKYETDFIIVGRGIYKSADPKEKAKQYQERSWQLRGEILKKKLSLIS